MTAAAHRVPTGAGFDIVLLLHVAAVVVGLGTVVVGGVMAARVLAAGDRPLAAPVVGYFAPGANRAGRVLYAVPVLGFALLAMSGGAYSFSDGWVDWGTGLWVLAIALAEGLLWPAERRVRRELASGETGRVRQASATACAAASLLVVVLVAAVVVMVAQP